MRLPTNAAALALTAVAATTALFGCEGGRGETSGVASRSSALAGEKSISQLVCHVPPGNPGNAHEIEVASSAVAAHLAHGDTLGPCVAPGPCVGQPDGTPCNDLDLCTTNDVCAARVCQPGSPVVCGGDTCQPGVCDPTTGACTPTIAPDGTSCDDGLTCTTGDACQAGVCVGRGPGDLAPGETKTFTCPSDAQATDGIVQPTTCEFIDSFAPNNVFTGPVSLISHLDRDFGGFDIFTLPDGRLQLGCAYQNSDGLQIGGTFGFTNATSCTPTDTSFVCTK
jgi:hypothetical protein